MVTSQWQVLPGTHPKEQRRGHVRQGLENIVWLSFAVTYDFLATKDINRDRVQDVIFLYKNTNSSNNSSQSCADEGKKEELPI